jgi:Protein of unknown function (DUF1592)/Protein of unknown function (DUF1588)/Protein of unknown function (DUF1595)/Protein of unknown function (DUF1585)/Protein of unknown function (DUF1587)
MVPAPRSPLRARLRGPWAGCVILALAAGCTGSIDGPNGPMTPGANGSAGATGGGPVGAAGTGGGLIGGTAGTINGTAGTTTGAAGSSATACSTATPDPGDAPLSRLTQEQYINSVHDLFGNINLTGVFPQSQSASQFGIAQADVDGSDLDKYQRAAELVAGAVVADKTVLARVAPCANATAAADGRACAKTFLQALGTRILRAPIADADLERHLKLFDAGFPNGAYAHGIELLLRGLLQAPRFLYRVELGTGEAVGPMAVKLSGYELAARLSYGLWSTAPDDTLIAAAKGGTLATPADVNVQLQRMLKDARGATVVRHFLEAWIHLPDLNGVAKNDKLYPEWNDDVRNAMTAQAQKFFDDLLAPGGAKGGTLASLLTSKTVFANSKLAPIYGAVATSFPADGSFTSSDKADGTAAGLLTLPAFLATQAKASESSPIYRGLFVREQLFCQQLPSPPANIPMAPEVTPGVSTRERLKQHEVDMSCATCHQLMDPIGLGFEHYDAIGRYRTMDGGKAVDATGTLKSTDVDGDFDGVSELGAKLATSARVEACVSKQWFRYSMGRGDQAADKCSIDTLAQSFHAAGADLRTLPAAIVQTPAFLYRRPLVGSN